VSPNVAAGVVAFRDGATPLCTNVPVSNGLATCSEPLTTAGSHSVIATYGGNMNYASSTSSALIETVIDQRPKTVQTIGQFLSRRTDQILANGPDGGRQIDRLNEAPGNPGGSSQVGYTSRGYGTADTRLSDGPNIGDISQMRLGLFGRPLASTFASDVLPAAPFGIGPTGTEVPGTGAAQIGPLGLAGSTDGIVRFSFSTSLRDMARFVAEQDARKAGGAGLGFAPTPGSAHPASFYPFDIWVDAKFSSFDDSRSGIDLSGRFGLLSVGADYVLNRSLLIGTMVQFDSAAQRSLQQASDAQGWGWLVGPTSPSG